MNRLASVTRFSSLSTQLIHIAVGLCLLITCCSTFASEKSDKILIIRPDNPQFALISKGIKETLGQEVDALDVVLASDQSHLSMAKIMAHNQPKSVVLMDNAAINAYAHYQKAYPKAILPPSIVIGTLFAKKVMENIPNNIIVLYETPAVTSLVDLRKTVSTPIKKVGVIYRESEEYTFQSQHSFCQSENIGLIGFPVKDDVSIRALKKALKQMTKSDLDAVWVMNDTTLLSKILIQEAWIPKLKYYEKPVVVGIPTLIKSQFTFGDYTVYPDHFEIGYQAGNILFDLMENGWLLESSDIQPPISIKKGINLHLLNKKSISVKKQYLPEFDLVITQ